MCELVSPFHLLASCLNPTLVGYCKLLSSVRSPELPFLRSGDAGKPTAGTADAFVSAEATW